MENAKFYLNYTFLKFLPLYRYTSVQYTPLPSCALHRHHGTDLAPSAKPTLKCERYPMDDTLGPSVPLFPCFLVLSSLSSEQINSSPAPSQPVKSSSENHPTQYPLKNKGVRSQCPTHTTHKNKSFPSSFAPQI